MTLSLSPFIYALGMASMLTVVACKQEKRVVFIDPPFEELTREFEEFKMDVSLGDTLVINSGTRIIIPPNALTDSANRIATGEATILYREFRDEIDVLLSGIPMSIVIGGETRHMQTAGMFELRAVQGDKQLGLLSSKRIEVTFASDEEGTDYNFFVLSDRTGTWKFLDYSKPEPNLRRITIKKRIEELRPQIKIPFEENYFVLNYSSFIDVYFDDNWYEIRKNANKPVYKNKAKSFGLHTYDLWSEEVTFKGNKYPAALMVWKSVSGHQFPKWTQSRYCEVKRIKGSVYQLKVSDYKLGKSFALNARLVMPLKYLFKFSPAQWQNQYDNTMVKISIEEARLANEAQVFRTMRLAGFGIYNIDRLKNLDNSIKIMARFEMNEPVDNELFGVKNIYGIPGDGRSIIKIAMEEELEFYLDPTDSNFRFFTVLPNDKIGMFTAAQYRKIDFAKLASMENPKYTFVLKVQPNTIRRESDINYLLEQAKI